MEWLRNTIGLVSQEPVLFAATVEENLRMGKPDATLDEMVKACKTANAHEFIAKLPQVSLQDLRPKIKLLAQKLVKCQMAYLTCSLEI